MKKLVFVTLFFLLFFGEIAISFSEKGYAPSLFTDEEVAFSLKLDNSYSDYTSTYQLDLDIQRFLQEWKIRGASVAISRDEKLVYAKGFGTANTEVGEVVKPGHLFRIASVSKLITAVAVMKLYENGQIDLDEKVFGPEGILHDSIFLVYRDKSVEEITVKHLLNHTAGWSRYAGDPLFNSLLIARKMNVEPPASLDNIIQYTLSRKLNYSPGKNYSYSNFGYALLGKIIEKKSGMPYQDYVVFSILKPLGIHDMHLGRSYFHEKFPNEVKYYDNGKLRQVHSVAGDGKRVPIFYGGNNIELLGPAGGWVASAPELIKLITAIDGCQGHPDILKPETLNMMIDPNLSGEGLFGWRGSDQYGNWWRTGYFGGSSALVMRQEGGINWVIMMNTSTNKQSGIHRYVSGMMFSTVSKIKEWPDIDLFMIDSWNPYPISEIPLTNPHL
ncbi:MAG: beta-lactamase family protein [Bacteroidales bacterium]|nr:beta-lactamase family protein [Bacteroidales bacterium]